MTFTKWIMVALAVALLWPAWLAAQQTPEPARPPRAPRPPRDWAFSWSDNRGQIGVVVRTGADVESDKLGAKLEAVTPGGPAEKAGLKAGDIITKFNGTSLAAVKAEDEDESGPGRRLIGLGRKLEPGDTVRIEYRRGSETKAATLVADDRAWGVFAPGLAPQHMPHMEGALREALERQLRPDLIFQQKGFGFGDGWGDLDLVTLNPELGEYFGTREGVLVVKASPDSGLPLRSGDVILSIGGRKPSSPSHAMRILRSYEAGETVSLELMRKQNRMSVTWKVPEAKGRIRLIKPGRERQEESRARL